MRRVRENSEAMKIAATQIAAGNQDLSDRTEAAASSVGEISSSMEHIVRMVEQSTRSASHAEERSQNACLSLTKAGVP
ncbi:hypothetical protein ASG35_12445 [Burkholderia sp. Leaf177]|nr:hypothetical protein ASG35_12445 [Burkholderia sp. Leaf177]